MQFSHYAIDSRLVTEGSVFFALEGEKVDGHAFLAEVKQRGGVAAVVRERYAGEDFGLQLIRVRSPLEHLQNLAKKKIQEKKPTIVGVTGSVGKTTTKDFIATFLSEAFPVAHTQGSENTKCTLPLTILNRLGTQSHLALEMGMTHTGDISKLIEIAPPHIALVTHIALSHAVNFASLKGIAAAKSEIYSHDATQLSLLPFEVNEKETLLSSIRTPFKTFSSLHVDADLFVTVRKEQLIVMEGGREIAFPNPHLPDHILSNLAAAILTARELGVNWEQIEAAIPKLKLPSQRMERIEKKGIQFINDCYNANLVSTKGALETLSKQKGRRILVFGEIRELGPFSAECHEEIGQFALDKADLLFCLGADAAMIHSIWKDAGKESFHFFSKAELAEVLKETVRVGDHILLKGSRSHGLWTLLEEFSE